MSNVGPCDGNGMYLKNVSTLGYNAAYSREGQRWLKEDHQMNVCSCMLMKKTLHSKSYLCKSIISNIPHLKYIKSKSTLADPVSESDSDFIRY